MKVSILYLKDFYLIGFYYYNQERHPNLHRLNRTNQPCAGDYVVIQGIASPVISQGVHKTGETGSVSKVTIHRGSLR